MANQSYLNLEDELKDQENDGKPYDSLSDRVEPPDFMQTQDSADDDDQEDVEAAPPPMMPADAVKAAIAKRLGAPGGPPPVMPPPGGADPLNSLYEKDQGKLNDLREAKRGADFIANLGQSFGQIAQGASTPKPNTGLYEGFGKQNSEMLKSQEEDLDRRQKIVNAIEARKSRETVAANSAANRKLIADIHSKDLAARAKEKADQKKSDIEDKYSKALKDDLDPNKARGGNLALNQKRVDNADRVQGLLDQVNNNPDPRQMEELAISTQALLSSSGAPAAEQVKALIPRSAWGDAKKFSEWISNNPQGTDQQKFVERMADTVHRERAIALNQVQKAQRQRLPAHAKFKNLYPDSYNSIVGGYGLSGDPADSSNDPDLKDSQAGPQPGDIEDGHKFLGGNPGESKNWEAVK